MGCMDNVLPVLLECCVLTKVDRMGDMPNKADDTMHEAKQMVNAHEDDNEEEDEEEDSYMTLRKSCAFTVEQFSRNYGDRVFLKMQNHL